MAQGCRTNQTWDRRVLVNEATKHFERVKFTAFWVVGAILSFVLYYSGIVFVYKLIRKHVFRKYRSMVLMYHRVRDDEKDPDMSVRAESFKKQLEYFSQHFDVLSLKDFLEGTKRGGRRKDTLTITFDDGYEDNYQVAFPVLKSFGMPATIFLISGESDLYEEMLTLVEINEMRKHAIGFGSHTVTHPILTELDPKAADLEITGSKKELEARLGETIRYFAYPKGKRYHFNDQIKSIVREAGYEAAFCTENGYVDETSDRFAIRRIGIRNVPMFVLKTRLSGIFESRPIYFLRRLMGLT